MNNHHPIKQTTHLQKERSMNALLKSTVIASALILSSAGAQSRDAIGPGDKDTVWVLGGGGGVFTNVYSGEDQSGSVFPKVRYNGDRIFINDGSLNVSLLSRGGFSGGLTVALASNFLSDEDDYRDNAQLAGLRERDATIEGGFYINHSSTLGRASLSVLTDLSNEHDGQSAALSYTFDLKLGNWFVNPSIGAQWLSDRMVAHYYGVSVEEATSQRAAYAPGSAINAFASIRGRYEFTDHWDIELHAGARLLDSSISNSSIVDEDYAAFGGLSINYNF